MLFTILYLSVCYVTVDIPVVLSLSHDVNVMKTFGQMIYQNGLYFGQTVTGEGHGRIIPHGEGTYTFQDGTIAYCGSWWNGYMHGMGRRYFENGDNFTGSFHYNDIHGRGQIFYRNGSNFSGQFKNNQISGPGVMTYVNGDQRSGTIKDGLWWERAYYFEYNPDEVWIEDWLNGTFEPSVKITKQVLRNISHVEAQVICKGHGPNIALKLFRNGQELIFLEPSSFATGDFTTLNLKLGLDLGATTDFGCQLQTGTGETKTDHLTVYNPFSIEAVEECGVQTITADTLTSRLNKRSISDWFGARIVDGSNAYRGEVPWQAIIFINTTQAGSIKDFEMSCGGAIIGSHHIVTAAHCVGGSAETPIRPPAIVVKVGMTTVPESLNGQQFRVKRMYIHPNFSNQMNEEYIMANDVALLILERPIRFNEYVSPVCLPSGDGNFTVREDQPLTISGFGHTFDPNRKQVGWFQSPHLKKATVFRKDLHVCIPEHFERASAFQGHFCAGGHEVGETFRYVDSCEGDSGGPLTFRDERTMRYFLLGLVSWGSRICGIKAGSMYVNMTHYVSWIKQAKLDAIIEDFRETRVLPFEWVDRDMFQSMFDYMLYAKDTVKIAKPSGERCPLEDSQCVRLPCLGPYNNPGTRVTVFTHDQANQGPHVHFTLKHWDQLTMNLAEGSDEQFKSEFKLDIYFIFYVTCLMVHCVLFSMFERGIRSVNCLQTGPFVAWTMGLTALVVPTIGRYILQTTNTVHLVLELLLLGLWIWHLCQTLAYVWTTFSPRMWGDSPWQNKRSHLSQVFSKNHIFDLHQV